MAQKTNAELLAQKQIIKTETTSNSNTANRIGQMFEDAIDSAFNKIDDAYTAPFPAANAAGTDTYTATLSPVITAYGSGGLKIQIVFANANTGAATLALNGLAAKAITKNGSTALVAGDISAGQALFLFYDGTQFQIQGGGGGGGSSAADVTFDPAGSIAATDVQAAIEELDTEKTDSLATIRTLTASHTLDSTDLASINAGAMLFIHMNVASANDMTVPANATVAFPVGTIIFVHQIGAGQTTLVAAGSVTIRNANGLIVTSQYSTASIRKIATNEWIATGELRV